VCLYQSKMRCKILKISIFHFKFKFLSTCDSKSLLWKEMGDKSPICQKHKSDMLNWIPKPQLSLISTKEDQLYLFDFSLLMKFASKILENGFLFSRQVNTCHPYITYFKITWTLLPLKQFIWGILIVLRGYRHRFYEHMFWLW
jgi:hypothetical protein